MSQKHSFKNNLEELQELFRQEKPIALFLGAGINGNFNKMGWNDLLESLMQTSMTILAMHEGLTAAEKKEMHEYLTNNNGKFSAYQKATLIKKVLGENYISYLQKHLYTNCNAEILKSKINDENIFLFKIAELIIKNPNIDAVITYNYDNFLKESIKLVQKKRQLAPAQPLSTVDIYRIMQKESHQKDKFPIFHVHGFIPPPGNVIKQDAENVVLSIDEYFDNMIEPFSWQTTTQLYYLNNYNCVFMGTSLDDWNMLRALSYSKSFSKAVSHFVLFVNEFNEKSPAISTFLNRCRSTIFHEVGIKPIYTESNDYNELYQITDSLTPIK